MQKKIFNRKIQPVYLTDLSIFPSDATERDYEHEIVSKWFDITVYNIDVYNASVV